MSPDDSIFAMILTFLIGVLTCSAIVFVTLKFSIYATFRLTLDGSNIPIKGIRTAYFSGSAIFMFAISLVLLVYGGILMPVYRN